MRLTRRSRVVAAVLVMVLGIATPVKAGGSVVNAVQWRTDEAGKTITATVSLAFYGPNASPAAVAAIAAAIRNSWNGHRYKCWKFVVDLHVTTLGKDSDGSDAGKDVMPIKLTGRLGGKVRARTGFFGGGGDSNALSIDPANATHPFFDPADPSMWPTGDEDATYTHEFGHIMGLHDNYQEGTEDDPQLLPGAKGDAMFGANPDYKNLVSEDMIDRAVERSGKVDTSKVHCDMSMDTNEVGLHFFVSDSDGIKLHGWTCDYQMPTNDPKHPPKPMEWHGRLTVAHGDFLGSGGSGGKNLTWNAFVDPSGKGGVFTIKAHQKLTMTLPVEWMNNGLLRAKDNFLFNNIPTSAIANDGVPMKATFTDGAAECGNH